MTLITGTILFVIVTLCCLQVWRHPDDKPWLAVAMGVSLFFIIIPALYTGSIVTGIVGAVFSALGGMRLPMAQTLSPFKNWR